MNELVELINRFQNLSDRTGRSKTSSYGVGFYFYPDSRKVIIELGGYDIGNWNRHTFVDSTRETLLEDFRKKIEEAEQLVNNEEHYE